MVTRRKYLCRSGEPEVLRACEPMSQREVARQLGVSASLVAQLESQALSRMRDLLIERGYRVEDLLADDVDMLPLSTGRGRRRGAE